MPHLDAIITTDLTKCFQDVPALGNLNLRIKAGTVFGFLGPNGAGKTTTIRLLLGLLQPSAGSAEVMGWSVAHDARHIRERVGVLLEHHGLYERLSAYDNLAYFADIYHLEASVKEQRIKELLGSIRCWERRHEKAGSWSKGMKQKLAIARALIHDPELVFLDEPTSGLDPAAAHQLRDELLELVKQAGKTIFITTHNLEEAEKVCDQVGVIDRGQLLATGSPSELRGSFSRPKVIITIGGGAGAAEAADGPEVAGGAEKPSPLAAKALAALKHVSGVQPVAQQSVATRGLVAENRISVELSDPDSVPAIIRALVAAEIPIQEVHKVKASLEDVFLSLTQEEGSPPSHTTATDADTGTAATTAAQQKGGSQ